MSSVISSVPWMQEHHKQAVGIAWILLIAYSLPVLLGCWALISSDLMKENSWAVAWFAAFLINGDSTLSEFHKLLLPIMTSISVVTFAGRPSRQVLYLAGLVLAILLSTICVSVAFDVGSVRSGIEGLEGELDPDMAKRFLGRIQETLMSFLMLLLGVSVVNASVSAPPAANSEEKRSQSPESAKEPTKGA